jgi:hypothetical protein
MTKLNEIIDILKKHFAFAYALDIGNEDTLFIFGDDVLLYAVVIDGYSLYTEQPYIIANAIWDGIYEDFLGRDGVSSIQGDS